MLSPEQRARVEELVKLIRHHRIMYYNNVPQIDDEEFDSYFDELGQLDPENEVLREVGAPVPEDSPWVTGKHRIPMGSLNKVNTHAEFSQWMSKLLIHIAGDPSICVQEKLDGFSVSLDYENGELVRALTRGAGIVGEDITRNILQAKGVVRHLPEPLTGSLRGECILTTADLDAYNQEAQANDWTVYKNPRNGASGLARRLSGKGVRYLTVLFYDLHDESNLDWSDRFESDKLELLESWGLAVPFYRHGSFETAVKTYEKYEESRRAELDYEIDGLVVKINDPQVADAIERALDTGSKASRNPRTQVAWKFADETRVTTVRNVIWQTGKSGQLAPIALVDPTPMGGVTVRRISVHNWSNIRNLGISLGAKVLIKRANEVIPQIIKVTGFDPLAVTGEIFPPRACPVCDSAVAVDGEYHVCTNPVCPAVVAGTIRKWIINLEIDNFGEKLIEQLMDAGKLKTIPDLYRLTESDLTALDRVGARSAQKALQNLHAKKEVPLHVFLGSLNIRGFGKTLAQHLVDAGVDAIDKVRALTPQELSEVPQFGPERSHIICESLTQLSPVIDDLLQFVTVKLPAGTSGALSGVTICLTGKLTRSKKVWQDLIEASGGVFAKSVSKSLDVLVCADPDSGSSKLVKARALGVKIISEVELEGML